MKSKAIALGGLLAAAVLGSQASAETLKLWTFLNPNGKNGREVALKQLIDRYQAANPSVKIQVEPQVWSELTKKFVLGANLGKAPDIVFTHGNNLRLLAESGAAADLDALIVKKWSAADAKDFLYDGLLQKARVNGKLMGVPVFPFATVLYYRKDLLEKAGKSAADLKTWDGFVAAMKAVGSETVSPMTIPLSPDRTTQTPFLTRLLDRQGRVFDDKCKPMLATDAAAEALKFQVSLFKDAKLASREDISRNLDDSWDLFLAGRAAAILNASTRAGQVAKKASWNAAGLGIGALPGISAGKAGPAVANAWFISVWEKSPNRAAAAAFVDYLVGRDGAQAWALIGGQPPLRAAVLNSAELAAPKYDLVRQIGSAISAATADLPAECRADRVYADLNEATQAVLTQGVPVAKALADAQAKAAARK
ncbi:MAG: sugar ABC transporter substrate-binding protein [Burkholderiaceae bacterium]|nr:sugar ABC transporter substrate-binding protein [Burkholderiaceae bacterium]